MNDRFATVTSPPRRPRYALWSLLTIILILCGTGIGWMLGKQQTDQGREALPIIGLAPTYHGFVNQLGQPVDSTAFAGKVRLVTFLFPYCTSYCPLIALHLTGLETELKQAGLQNRVELIAFNVDPRHTGPAQARAFLKQYGWTPSDLHWQYLSSSVAQTRRVVRDGYHIAYEQVSTSEENANAAQQKASGTYMPQPQVANALADQVKPTYDIAHNDALVLVDPHGRVRWIDLHADQATDNHVLKLIRSLLPSDQGHV